MTFNLLSYLLGFATAMMVCFLLVIAYNDSDGGYYDDDEDRYR